MSAEKTTLKLPGLFFGPGEPFSSRRYAQQAYNALLGDGDARKKLTLDAAKSQVSNRITQLFQLCLDLQGLYTALRGGDTFWDTVASQWEVSCDLGGQEVEEIVRVFINAPNAYMGSANTALTQSIRQWASKATEVAQMAPANQLQIPHHPHPVVAVSGSLQELQIGPIQQPINQDAWPNLYFSRQELAWMSDLRIRGQLAGVVPFKPQRPDQMPRIPGAYTSPLSIRLFLCFSGLANYASSAPWALYMNPIAFPDATTRRKWYFATGSLSKAYSTLEEFVEYAQASLRDNRRGLVCGIFTNWRDTPDSVVEAYPRESNQRYDEFWVQRCKQRAVVVVLECLDNTHRFRLAMFDPSVTYQHLREPMTMQGSSWKMDILKTMGESFSIAEVWQGGVTSGALSELGVSQDDSVELCCGFI